MANNNKYEILFSPISIGNMQLRNRIVMTAAATFTTLFDRGPMINAKRFAKVIGLFV